MSIIELYQIYLKHPRIQTDTRQLQAGDFFFALKGDRFDGNAFAAQAISAGAAAVVIDNPTNYIDERTIVVDDVLQTLQQPQRDLTRHLMYHNNLEHSQHIQ